MIRALSYALALALLVAGAVWLADRPGVATVEWLGWRVETTVPVLLAVLLAFAALLVWLFHFVAGLVRLPGRWVDQRRERRRRKGYQALTDGLAAAAAGQVGTARKLADRADKLLADPVLTRFLAAQTAQLSGDAQAAREHFNAMLDRPETAAVGLRGLLDQALACGDADAAIDLAGRARVINPADSWLADILFAQLIKAGRLREAQDLTADAERRSAWPRGDALHRRALVLNERAARAAADGDSRNAATFAKQALAADPGLIPAALRLSEAQAAAGRTRRGAAVLEKAWASRPTPELARAYVALWPGEDPLRQVRRLEKLERARPGDAETHLALGEASLNAKLWGQARKHLLAAAEARPSARPYRLLARLEQEEYGNPAAAQAWVDKAAAAPADPAWQCRTCGATTVNWSLTCPHCSAIDALDWASSPSSERLRQAAEQGSFPASIAEIAQR